jgi:hypothetical protein
MRYAALVLVFVAGCGAPAPALTLAEECRLGAWLALHVAKEAPPLSVPSPDKPDQGETCEECGGAGKLGDGTVFVKCGACNGTGKKPAAAFDTPASAEAFEGMELKQEAVDRAARLDAAAAKAAKPEAPQAAPGPERYAVPPADGRTYRKVCRAGSCAWEPVQ